MTDSSSDQYNHETLNFVIKLEQLPQSTQEANRSNQRYSFKSSKSSNSINRCKSVEITEVNFLRDAEMAEDEELKTQIKNMSNMCS